MAPIVTLLLAKVLDYLAEHSGEIIKAIKERFVIANTDPHIKTALQELGYNPNAENLDKVHDLLLAHNEDVGDLAKILINKTNIA